MKNKGVVKMKVIFPDIGKIVEDLSKQKRTLNLEEDILFYAFRYALGRETYVVRYIVDALCDNWKYLSKENKEMIKKEITRAIETNQAGRSWRIKQWNRIYDLK